MKKIQFKKITKNKNIAKTIEVMKSALPLTIFIIMCLSLVFVSYLPNIKNAKADEIVVYEPTPKEEIYQWLNDIEGSYGLRKGTLLSTLYIAGNKDNLNFDIYNENTEKSLYEIPNVKQKYNKKTWIEFDNRLVQRGETNFLDSSQNVAYTIYKWNKKFQKDYKKKYLTINASIKDNIIYYTALANYLNLSDECKENIGQSYLDLVQKTCSKGCSKNDKVVFETDGKIKFETIYEASFEKFGIKDFNKLAPYFMNDNVLFKIEKEDIFIETSDYTYGLSSKENMLKCAFSLLGDVRYVWGGGHQNTSDIIGVNPIWKYFNDIYKNNEEHIYDCIMPEKTWCPVHGSCEHTENGCTKYDTVKNIEDYFDKRECYHISDSQKNELIDNLAIQSIGFGEGIDAHRIEGLDCSGYVAFLFNQIDTSKNYEGPAREFAKQNGFYILNDYNNLDDIELKPCDTVAWNTHIILVVGALNDNTYLIIEQAPPTIQLGIAYKKYNEKDIEQLEQVIEQIHQKYDVNITEISEYDLSKKSNLSLGRSSVQFIDQNDWDNLPLENILEKLVK